MPNSAYAIVGRIRKAHGIHGEVVVETITGSPDVVFAVGRRVVPGTEGAVPLPDAEPLVVHQVRPFMQGLLVGFVGIRDRNDADAHRGSYLLLPFDELEPLAEGEVYLHDLIGMDVRLVSGEAVGQVTETYELPQGIVLDVRRPDRGDTVMVPYRGEVVRAVDPAARVITIDPPVGLLD